MNGLTEGTKRDLNIWKRQSRLNQVLIQMSFGAMASFVPNHRKKSDRLERVEGDLRRLITRGAGQDKLLEAAAEVRDCRIRVLKAKQNQNPERNPKERATFLRMSAKIRTLQTMPAETVLAEFL